MIGSYCFCFRQINPVHAILLSLPRKTLFFRKISTHSCTNMIISRPFASKQRKVRLVPPFVADVFYANTRVIPFHWPGQCGDRRSIKFKLFRFYFTVGELPVGQEFGMRKDSQAGLKLKWYIHPAELNYFHYLPIFFDGLVETDFPFSYVARSGIHDLLKIAGGKVLPVLPQLILPIKNALHTKNRDVVNATLTIIRALLETGPYIGLALVPYYSQILPILNVIRCAIPDENLCDKMSYNKGDDLAQTIDRTVELMERLGGPDAYINIKFAMPTYESCVLN